MESILLDIRISLMAAYLSFKESLAIFASGTAILEAVSIEYERKSNPRRKFSLFLHEIRFVARNSNGVAQSDLVNRVMCKIAGKGNAQWRGRQQCSNTTAQFDDVCVFFLLSSVG